MQEGVAERVTTTAADSFWTLLVGADNLLGDRGRDQAANDDLVARVRFAHSDLTEALPTIDRPHVKLAAALVRAINQGQGAAALWNTLVTQNTIPNLLRGWTPPQDDPPRIRWEVPAIQIDANQPVSCVRILGTAVDLGDTGTWASGDRTGDPLTAAAVQVSRGEGTDARRDGERDRACRSVNMLHEAARIWLMARRQVHVISPQAARSRESARTAARPDTVFYGGADDGAHAEVAALAQNWLGGRPDSTTAWSLWNLASEVGPGAEEIRHFFSELDYDADVPVGSTLRTGQDAFGGPPVRPPPPREPTPRRPVPTADVTQLQLAVRRLTRELDVQRAETARLQTAVDQRDAEIVRLRAARPPPPDIRALIGPQLDELRDFRIILFEWLQAEQTTMEAVVKGLRRETGALRPDDLEGIFLVTQDEEGRPLVDVRPEADDRVQRWEQAPLAAPLAIRLLALPCRAEAHFSIGARGKVDAALAPRETCSMANLTADLVEAILATARSEREGRPILRRRVQRWAQGRDPERESSIAASLTTLCDNVLRGDHHLEGPYVGLGLVNGYRDCLRNLMREVSEVASHIRSGGIMREATQRCLNKAERVGRSIGQEWREA